MPTPPTRTHAGPWTHGQPVAATHHTLPAWLAQQAQARGGSPALTFWDNGAAGTLAPAVHSYTDLHLRSQALATWLHGAGVQTGDRVAWLGWGHPDVVGLLLALARLGAALVPLNHRLAAAEWAQVMADCTPRLLVHDPYWGAQAQALGVTCGVPVHPVPPQFTAAADRGAEPDQATPNSAALLVYTSGTTGRPKGAVHTQANLLANMAIAAQVQGIQSDDRVLTVLPLFHVGGLCIQTLPALYQGAHVHLLARFDASDTLRLIEQVRPTLTLQVPATLKALSEHPRWPDTPLSSLRAVWAGSSPLPTAQIAPVEARGVPVCNVYGATETGPFSIALPPHTGQSPNSCGWPAPGVSVALGPLPGAAQPPGPGEVGELWLRGPNVVTHYWPDQPACDGQGYFHSGDLAHRAPDGSWTVVGRCKDMVISGGENIYPAEVEQALLAVPGVAEVAVLGVPDPQWGEAMVAVVVPRTGLEAPPLTATGLGAALQGRLARYKQPRRYVFLEALPKTALGKVQKHLLAAAVTSGPGVDPAGQPNQQQHR